MQRHGCNTDESVLNRPKYRGRITYRQEDSTLRYRTQPYPHPPMQRPDEQKRQLIIDTAARFFATQPFHKVRLDDVAAAAQVGKGTLYIYFKSKEDLYVSQ